MKLHFFHQTYVKSKETLHLTTYMKREGLTIFVIQVATSMQEPPQSAYRYLKESYPLRRK